MAFLAGMASEELSSRELDTHDAAIPVLIAVRAVMPGGVRGPEAEAGRRLPSTL
jgi:hypothetical protein